MAGTLVRKGPWSRGSLFLPRLNNVRLTELQTALRTKVVGAKPRRTPRAANGETGALNCCVQSEQATFVMDRDDRAIPEEETCMTGLSKFRFCEGVKETSDTTGFPEPAVDYVPRRKGNQ